MRKVSKNRLLFWMGWYDEKSNLRHSGPYTSKNRKTFYPERYDGDGAYSKGGLRSWKRFRKS